MHFGVTRLVDFVFVDVQCLMCLGKFDLFVWQMHIKCVFFVKIINDLMALSHFRMAEYVSDCLWIKSCLSPSWNCCILNSVQDSSNGNQVKQFVVCWINVCDYV